METGAEHRALEGEPEQEEEEGAAELLDSLYCVACDKLFRTEGAKVILNICLLLYLGIALETKIFPVYLIFCRSFCIFCIVRILILMVSSIRYHLLHLPACFQCWGSFIISFGSGSLAPKS